MTVVCVFWAERLGVIRVVVAQANQTALLHGDHPGGGLVKQCLTKLDPLGAATAYLYKHMAV